MGYSLAKEIMLQEKERIKAAIILDDMQKECIGARFDGVYDTLSGYADEIVIWEKDEHTPESELTLFLQEKMIEEAVDVAIAMDTPRTEALIDAAQNLNKDIKIYGIGNSDKIVHYLDQGLVKAVAYQNDFSAGYLSMNVILQGKQEKNLEDALEERGVEQWPLIVGVNGQSEALEMIKRKKMEGTVYHDAKGQGQAVAEIAYALSTQTAIPESVGLTDDRCVYTPYSIVDYDNVQEYSKRKGYYV